MGELAGATLGEAVVGDALGAALCADPPLVGAAVVGAAVGRALGAVVGRALGAPV